MFKGLNNINKNKEWRRWK